MSIPEALELVEQTPLEQLGIQHPKEYLLGMCEKWEKKDSVQILASDAALLSCRGVASQIISPKHVEFSKKIETVHPPEERFINQTQYSLSSNISRVRRCTAKIIFGWEDRELIVAPGLGIKNGKPEEFAFMLPGKGIIYDGEEEGRLQKIVKRQSSKIPKYIEDMSDGDILRTLRHISLVIGDNKRMS